MEGTVGNPYTDTSEFLSGLRFPQFYCALPSIQAGVRGKLPTLEWRILVGS